MVIFTIFRAVFGYLFLVLMVRVVGRRPGKQLTPVEFVLVFYLGGLTLTGLVGTEVSLTNAVYQILTVAVCHYALSAVRFASGRVARLLDVTLDEVPDMYRVWRDKEQNVTKIVIDPWAEKAAA